MKIKPDEIDIPCDDPFEHDQLGRKQTALILTNLLLNTENPYTISVDASWGNGKTTFLKMWKQHLRNENFPVIEFNAWETDFVGDPLVAIASELLENTKEDHSQQVDEPDKPSPSKKLRTATNNLLNHITPARFAAALSLINLVVSAQPDDQITSSVIGAVSASTAAADAFSNDTKEEAPADPPSPPDPISYHDTKKAICSFKTELQNVASHLSCKHQNKPLVIAIDELDRCRPSYAVELLEVVKHFFAVENIVFVLAIDKSQLSHAIRAIYGNNFDSIGYLRRFIDLDFRLPDPDRTELMNHLMSSTGIDAFFEKNSSYSWGKPSDTKKLFKAFLSLPALSIRQIQQTLHRLGFVLASLDTKKEIAYVAIAVLTILKTIDPETYRRFVQADMTDREVSEHLFNMPGLQSIKDTSNETLFEAFLIIGYGEFALTNNKPITTGPSLFHSYFHIIENLPDFPMHYTTNIDNLSPPLSDRERQVLSHIASLSSMFRQAQKGTPVGFNLTAQRIELFSSDLLGDNS